jgi:hypothetical protein
MSSAAIYYNYMKQLKSALNKNIEPSLGIPSFIAQLQPEPQPEITTIDATAAIAINFCNKNESALCRQLLVHNP